MSETKTPYTVPIVTGTPPTDSVAAIEECRAGRMAELGHVPLSPFALVAEDYEFMMRHANSLGGVEIV